MSEKLAVVSGGGTGIGEAITRGLTEDGYQVIIVGRRAQPLENVASDLAGVTPVVADLADITQIPTVVSAVAGRPVDVLVNNAGGFIGADGGELADVAAQWQRTFEVNVMTAVLLTEALIPALRSPGGRLILMSSIAAQRGGGGPYSAAKAALHGWVYDLAARLGPGGMTANVISPGYVVETEFFGNRMTPEGHAARVASTVVGRPGVPKDIADAVRWLAGPSGGFVTGQVIGVNGGSVFTR